MGHQVNFFVLPGDLPAIEAAVLATGDVCFLEDRTLAPAPAHVRFSPGDVTQWGYWVIDDAGSSVMEFFTGFFDGIVLRRGRAYFASDLRFRPQLPDPGFVKWGDLVLARIRKLLIRVPEISSFCYFSPAALQWIRQDGIAADKAGLEFRLAQPGH